MDIPHTFATPQIPVFGLEFLSSFSPLFFLNAAPVSFYLMSL
jgi:hypothetical protein